MLSASRPKTNCAIGVRKMGYVRAAYAVWRASKIGRGYDVHAMVEHVKGASMIGATLGLVLLNMDGEEPEPNGEATLPPDSLFDGGGSNLALQLRS